ncbi:hypothetical protein Q8F55_009267 [Vanrija albida]|uniref:Uncharacterized protein n=1 Tax=Vanrija albida TaxID=181172 RepID=A0ABR3PT70_9TREE
MAPIPKESAPTIELLSAWTHKRVPGLDWNGARALFRARLAGHCPGLDKVVHASERNLDGICDQDIRAARDLESALYHVKLHRSKGHKYTPMLSLPNLDHIAAFLDPKLSAVFHAPPLQRLPTIVLNIQLGDGLVFPTGLSALPNLKAIVVIVGVPDTATGTNPNPVNCEAIWSLLQSIADLIPRGPLLFFGLEEA